MGFRRDLGGALARKTYEVRDGDVIGVVEPYATRCSWNAAIQTVYALLCDKKIKLTLKVGSGSYECASALPAFKIMRNREHLRFRLDKFEYAKCVILVRNIYARARHAKFTNIFLSSRDAALLRKIAEGAKHY